MYLASANLALINGLFFKVSICLFTSIVMYALSLFLYNKFYFFSFCL